MADALCGPSNPLQNFQKHSSADRTLQQDRLARSGREQQGFRSSPGPNAGILDAEFEAFQKSRPSTTDGQFENHAFDYQSPGRPALHDEYHPAVSGWASDFQHLQLKDQTSVPLPAFHHEQDFPQQHQSTSAWQQDFWHEFNDASKAGQPTSYAPRPYHSQPMSDYDPSSSYNFPPRARTQVQEVYVREKQTDDRFDEEFALAEAEAQRLTVLEAQTGVVSDDSYSTVPESGIQNLFRERIGSDKILDDAEEESGEKIGTDDADELARTAGALLDKVKDDQSTKFRQSNFLSLMRQLRDREVRLEGDQLVDASQPLHPGGEFYPIS